MTTSPVIAAVYDVESVGLRGDPWAVAAVWLHADGSTSPLAVGWTRPTLAMAHEGDTDPGAALAFAAPAVAALEAAVHPGDCTTPARTLWDVWQAAKAAGVPLLCDCVWPVDTRAMLDAHDLAMREGAGVFDGPFPLLDVTSIVGRTTGPIPAPDGMHDPRVDAAWSARRLYAAGWRGWSPDTGHRWGAALVGRALDDLALLAGVEVRLDGEGDDAFRERLQLRLEEQARNATPDAAVIDDEAAEA